MPFDAPTLTSVHNPHVKYARSLHQRKNRYRERAFIVEGTRAFHDAIDSGASPQQVFFDTSRADPSTLALLEQLDTQGIRIHPTNETVISAVADTQTPQGLVAIFEFLDLELQPGSDPLLVVVADGIKDPGNLGTLMRAALGAGCHALFVSPETTDPYSPKVVRAGMGAHFRLPLRTVEWSAPPDVILGCAHRFAAEASGDANYDRVDWSEPSILIVGGETGGITKTARPWVSETVAIPLRGGLESLNAAVAGAVILFEAARQRRTQ